MKINVKEDIKGFIKACRNAETTCDLTHCLLDETQMFGIDQVMLIEFQQLGNFLIPTLAKGCVNSEFSHRYLKESLYQIDPFLAKANCDSAPFTFQEVFHAQCFVAATRDFASILREYGMLDGFVVPIHPDDGAHPSSGVKSMVTYMGAESLETGFEAQLTSLARRYRCEMKRMLNAPEPEATDTVLTPRQLECVTWIAKGKSDWEIAAILGLSEATVNRHVELAKERLGVHTRVQVVVEALRAGHLDFGGQHGLHRAG